MSAGVNRLGLEALTLFGMNPVDHVRLAAELGCSGVSLTTASMDLSAFGVAPLRLYQPWSLSSDAALRAELRAALADTGLSIALAEGFMVLPDRDVGERAADLDMMAGLGAVRVNAISREPDLARAHDQFAILAGMVVERGMRFMVEFAPTNMISSLPMAQAVADHVGDHCGLMFDVMHLIRSGGSFDDIRALPRGRLGYAQLCDAPLTSPGMPYMEEAIFHRLVPGEGELPLAEMLEVLPPDFHVGIEVPDLTALQKGVTPRAHAARVVNAARALGF